MKCENFTPKDENFTVRKIDTIFFIAKTFYCSSLSNTKFFLTKPTKFLPALSRSTNWNSCVQIGNEVAKLDQTWSNLIKLVQTCSNLIKLD